MAEERRLLQTIPEVLSDQYSAMNFDDKSYFPIASAPAGHNRDLTRLHSAGALVDGALEDVSPVIGPQNPSPILS